MPDINITVAHKVAVSDTQSIVCDNSDYTVHWTLDEEWSAYDTKTMRTIYMDGTYTDKVFGGDVTELPVCTVPGVVQIGLFAGDIRASRMAIMRALPSVRSAAGAPADPTPDVYDQLMELIKGLGGADPEAIKTAVAEYLAAHPIEETDPTVPAWAKAETKPTYSAEEVGAIAQSDLQTATDAALAQAKASGEFDGATGPAGPQGLAGAPGKDGAGMDVTGAQVGQIAKIAAVGESGVPTAWSPVDMPTGGETWELIASGVMAETAKLSINKDNNGLPFSLKSAQIFVRGDIGITQASCMSVQARRWASNSDYDSYLVEVFFGKENPKVNLWYILREKTMPMLFWEVSGIEWQSADCKVLMGVHTNSTDGKVVRNKDTLGHLINDVTIGAAMGNGNMAAGCKWEMWGVRA